MRQVLEEFRSGRRIYIPGSTGESQALTVALTQNPDRMAGVDVVSCLLPGMNSTDYAALHETARLTVFLPGLFLRASFQAGRVAVLPLCYSGIAAYIGAGPAFDVAIAQLSPPGPDQLCSLGIAADFSSLAWANARRRVAIINPLMPSMPHGPRLDPREADVMVTVEAPLICAPAFRTNTQLTAIAKHIAALVPEGAAIQLGIGGAPAVAWRELASHRNLVIASGMVMDDLQNLAQAGALAASGHCAGIAYGSMTFYQFLAEHGLIEFATTRATHDSFALAARPKFTAINSAIEVDLFGQINLEWRGSEMVSGVGGAPDFMRAAAASPGGRSIVALASTVTGNEGVVSKIVPRLNAPAISIARGDVDTVVTEYGAAQVKGLAMDQRAIALIGIAAPEHREPLAAAWHDLRVRF